MVYCRMESVSARLHDDEIEIIETMKDEWGVSQSEAIRRLIRLGNDEIGDDDRIQEIELRLDEVEERLSEIEDGPVWKFWG